jgi:hypothetical protein
LQKRYRNLWIFGDSYSTPDVCVSPEDSFWGSVAKKIGVDEIHNYSRSGNSLDSIIHLLISESTQYSWDNDFFLIGIPPLVRLTVVSDDDRKAYHKKVYDKQLNQVDERQILCHHGLESRSFYNDPLAVRFEDPTWNEIQACRQIFLINQWLDRNNTNYILINLSKDFQNDLPSTGKFLLEQCLNHPRNILVGKTYWGINYGINKPADFDEYGWSGHHGRDGNRYFFEKSLLPKMKQCGLI